MNDQQMTTKKALTVLAFLLLLVGFSLVIPAKWLGVGPLEPKRNLLVLKSADDLAILSKDNNSNNNPDWKDLLVETTSASTTAVAKKHVATEEEKARLNDPNNLTSSFSKNLYLASSYAKKKGGMTEAEQKTIVSDLLLSEGEKLVTTHYTITDIKVASTDTLAIKKAYGNTMGNLVKKASQYKLDIVDLATINAYNTSKDPAVLASLVIKKNNAQVIINELLNVQVPKSAVPYHLLIINRVSDYKTILEGLSVADSDPVKTTIAYNKYMPILESLTASLVSLQDYFLIEGVTFQMSEPGYIITSGYTTR